MLMAFKYQCQMVVQPEEIYHITKKHLETMKQLIAGSTNVAFIQVAEEKFDSMCSNFTGYDYIVIRQ